MESESVSGTEKTPGQRAQEASVMILFDRFGDVTKTWDQLTDEARDSWEAIAAAANAAIRERLALLADGLEASAAASAPSKKSEIEQRTAAKVRAVLGRDEAIPDAPAITGAGTEHLARQLLDPADPGAWQRVADMPAEPAGDSHAKGLDQ